LRFVVWIFIMSLIINNTLNTNVSALHRALSFGHRGVKGSVVENSLQGFAAAIRSGVDGVELDVWRCKTGELVVFHDALLGRLTKSNDYLVGKTFTDLRKLKLDNGEQIPTLQECLQLIDRQCQVNIELKGPNTALQVAELIKEFIARYGWKASDFIVTSYDQPELQKFNLQMPGVQFGPIISGTPLHYAKFAADMHATHLVIDHEYAPKEFIVDAQKRDLKVVVYTVNDIRDIERMQRLGVDVIISDFPERIL
jgi:glycerophosphoryl diester phosphodiesterase